MAPDIAFSRYHGIKAGKELIGRLDATDPSLIMLFPTEVEARKHDVQAVADVLVQQFDCQVAGISVGAYATDGTHGLESSGMCAVALPDVSLTTSYLPDMWDQPAEDLVPLLQDHDGTVLSFESGSRSGGNKASWRVMQRVARRVMTQDSLGQRKRLIRSLNNSLTNYRLGYTPMYKARLQALKDGAQLVNFSSCDNGDMVNGYEIWGDTVTNSAAAGICYIDRTFDTHVAQTTDETLSESNILETFDDIGSYQDIIYRFGTDTFRDLCHKYPIGQSVGRGGFSHYLLLETEGSVIAVPLSSDLGAVVSPVPVDPYARAHLVRAPGFDDYQTTYRSLISQCSTTPHIRLNPPQLDYFRNSLNKIVDISQNECDQFLITVDNAYPRANFDYNYPSYVTYDG